MALAQTIEHPDMSAADHARRQIKPGFSLPAYYYEDAGRFAVDMDVLLGKSWLLAGHASEIPKAGDYFLFEVGNESIIIIRAKDGGINAFYNVCRHRGSRICLEQSGNSRLLVCPYHAWTYDAEGRLVGSPDMPEWFDRADYGLKPCHAGVIGGFVFVNLAQGETPDFEAFTARPGPFIAPYQLDNAKVVARDVLSCSANWKLVLENFAECYHCVPSHKEYARIHALDTMLLFTDPSAGEGEWAERAGRCGLKTEPFFDDPSSFDFQSALSLRVGDNSLSGGRTGQPMAPRLGEISEWSGSWTAAVFGPTAQIACYDDHAIAFSFIPRGPMLTDCIVTWLVRDDAVEGRDFDADEVAYMWRHTIAEDKTICANNQLGVASSAYEPGPYSNTESRASETVDWYVRHFLEAR